MSFSLSINQRRIIGYDGGSLKVIASAGAGKTFVLEERVRANPSKRFLYLAYNRPIKEEAASKFPKENCVCKTFHGLSFGFFGQRLKSKLVDNLKAHYFNKFVSCSNQAKHVLAVIEAFLISDLELINETLIPAEVSSDDHEVVLEAAEKAWLSMQDEEADTPISHDGHLKMLALNPGLINGFDEILIDEAQDSNGAKIQLIKGLEEECSITLVGDPAQQIYRFTGCEDAFLHPYFKHYDLLTLSQSFRFGESIGIVSNLILGLKTTKNIVTVKGSEKVTRIVKQLPIELDFKHMAIISRTVLGCIEQGLKASIAGESVFWVGGLDSYGVSDLLDLGNLKAGKPELIKNESYREYASYKEFCKSADSEQDPSKLRLIKLVDLYRDQENLVTALNKAAVDDEALSTVTICTAHKSKGMDWENVVLNDDFPSLLKPRDKDDLESHDDELNLAYVAITRAMENLVYGDSMLSELFDDIGLGIHQKELAWPIIR